MPQLKHPLRLISFTCFMMLYQIFWLIRVLQLQENLKQPISLSVPLEVIISVSIVTFFTYGLRALILNREWAMRYTIGIVSFQIGYSGLRLIAFSEADYDRQRLPFLIIVFSVVCCLLMLPKILRHIHTSIKGEKLV
jgi:hypothetical protein